jgi:hypothetical protein
MKAETLARLRSIARGEVATLLGGEGATFVTKVTSRKPGVTPVTPEKDQGTRSAAEVSPVGLSGQEKPDVDAIEERAGLSADRVPPAYLEAWARLNCQKPVSVSEGEWRLALDDGGQLLDAWGNEAAEMGWTAGEFFDVAAGLFWRMAGERVETIGPDRVQLTGGRTIIRQTLATDI